MIEILIASAIFMGLLTAIAVGLMYMSEKMKFYDEKGLTSVYASQIENSVGATDPTMNISVSSVFPWGGVSTYNTLDSYGIGQATSATLNTVLYNGNITCMTNYWFMKIALIRGITATDGTVYTDTTDSDIRRIAVNTYGMQRLFLAAPVQSGVQRYMLISVALPPSRGVVWPTDDGSQTYFDEIWNNNWGIESTTAPVGWSARLTGAQVTAWNTVVRGRTNAGRVFVHKIPIRKYKVIINNNHATYSAWADWDGVTNQMTSTPSSGSQTSSVEILAGRMIVIREGTSAPGNTFLNFALKETTSATVQ